MALDLSGRPFLHYEVEPGREPLGTPPFDPQLAEEFWRAFATSAAITLHLRLRSGKNPHHILEASFKGVARCLRDAVRIEGGGVPSTKGTLDAGMIAVLDYGIGNLRSAQKALEQVGADAVLTDDPATGRGRRTGVVLPGVGAFGRCMEALRASGLDEVALRRGRRRAGRSSASASACRCCTRRPRRTPASPGSACSTGRCDCSPTP